MTETRAGDRGRRLRGGRGAAAGRRCHGHAGRLRGAGAGLDGCARRMDGRDARVAPDWSAADVLLRHRTAPAVHDLGWTAWWRAPASAPPRSSTRSRAAIRSRGSGMDADSLQWREQESEVRQWMTVVDQVQLDPESPLEPNAEWTTSACGCTVSPRRTVTVWPFGRNESSGRADFTYIR